MISCIYNFKNTAGIVGIKARGLSNYGINEKSLISSGRLKQENLTAKLD